VRSEYRPASKSDTLSPEGELEGTVPGKDRDVPVRCPIDGFVDSAESDWVRVKVGAELLSCSILADTSILSRDPAVLK